MSLLRGLPEIGIKAAKKTAPFYSAVDDALSNLKRPKGTGIEFLTEVMKTKGVKKAEIADRKLEQAFKAKGKMTKEEAQEVLKENPPPQIKEKVYDESTAIDEDDLREMVSQEMFGKPYSQISFGSAQHRKISDEVYKRMDADNGTTYGRYRTPDGENYREILLKLPVQGDDAKKLNEISMTLHGVPYTSLTGDTSEMAKLRLAVKREYRNLYGESGAVAEDRAMYRSNHWKDDANVLAHMRVQDRKGPNGEKILHVEEIQSDWHQAGRKKGYKPDDYVEQSNALEKEFKDLVNKRGELRDEAERIGYRGEGHRALVDEANSITPRLMQLQEQRDNLQNVINYGVPEAPFKKNWHELAMKRLLNYAAENGYDSIAITPGAEQAKRYDLSKQISRVVYSPDTEMLNAFDSNNKSVVMHSNVKPDQVADYIGKEPAQRLFDEQNTKLNFKGGKDVPYQEISGIDLQVGGEGMKGFYDKILPDYLNTFGKPYGAQMGTFSIPGDRGATVERLGVAGRNLSEMTPQEVIDFNKMVDEAGAMKLHSFPITPEMRESIKQKGLPLYQQIGIPTAGAGAASQMLEPQEEPQYGTGGAIAKMALKAAPPPRSPQIIKPSTLTELKKVVQQEKGGYGARRLERAADEVPNLEKLYQEKALREAFTGDNAKALMTMNPADFEKYAAKLFTLEPSQGVLPQGSSDDYLNYLRKLQGFRDVPFLEINKREQGTPVVPYISGHEGRHRSRAMTKNDETSSLVRLLPRSEMREPFPRRSQEEYIEALKEELALTGNKVKPENYTNLDSIKVITRPPIDLPNIYAKGGAVKPQVKKSVSGKVKMTDNRDAMFMELSNNKLKRK